MEHSSNKRNKKDFSFGEKKQKWTGRSDDMINETVETVIYYKNTKLICIF